MKPSTLRKGFYKKRGKFKQGDPYRLQIKKHKHHYTYHIGSRFIMDHNKDFPENLDLVLICDKIAVVKTEDKIGTFLGTKDYQKRNEIRHVQIHFKVVLSNCDAFKVGSEIRFDTYDSMLKTMTRL
jgi:hypothetical protein